MKEASLIGISSSADEDVDGSHVVLTDSEDGGEDGN